MRRSLPHDRTNALAASALVLETGLATTDDIADALASFATPEHRLEPIDPLLGRLEKTSDRPQQALLIPLDEDFPILGGKTPNIQNLAVGGVANAINLDNQATLNMNTLYNIKSVLDEMTAFIQQVYLVDVAAIGSADPRLVLEGARPRLIDEYQHW